MGADRGAAPPGAVAVAGMTRATVLSETEAAPASWSAIAHWPRPDEPADDPLPALDWPMAWARVEAWIAHRWTPRAVVYDIEGPGAWAARLRPFTIETVETWRDDAWTPETARPAPDGGLILDCGRWRVTGVAGADAGDVPAPVADAVRRLVEYNQGVARSWWADTAEIQSGDTTRAAAWAARGLHLSGAADLLRPWRRLGA